MVHLLKGSSHGFYLDTVTNVELLTYQLSANDSVALTPAIEGVFMCIFVVLLINKFTYYLVLKEKRQRLF